MIYDAAIENDKLVMTPPASEHFSKYAKKEVALADAARQIGMVELEKLYEGNTRGYLHLKLRDDKDTHLLFNVTLDDIGARTSALVEIPTMGASIPFDVMQDELGKKSKGAVDRFLHDVFNDVAAGRSTEHGYNTRALVNPAAVETVEDAGGYRNIRFKPGFGHPKSALRSPLPAQELNRRLGLKP